MYGSKRNYFIRKENGKPTLTFMNNYISENVLAEDLRRLAVKSCHEPCTDCPGVFSLPWCTPGYKAGKRIFFFVDCCPSTAVFHARYPRRRYLQLPGLTARSADPAWFMTAVACTGAAGLLFMRSKLVRPAESGGRPPADLEVTPTHWRSAEAAEELPAVAAACQLYS